ncbi:MAG: hypothetical protein CMLOHMNK_01569 [Steroidobacteraceae bacterium]|nr:hypothetical protein [Steroidobacteraceae bacterium]
MGAERRHGHRESSPEHQALSRARVNLITRLLSLALLCAQLGAQAHAYSHFGSDPHGAPATTQLCSACLSITPLCGAVGPAPLALPVDLRTAQIVVPAESVAPADRFHHPAFRSRAPPAVLRAD